MSPGVDSMGGGRQGGNRRRGPSGWGLDRFRFRDTGSRQTGRGGARPRWGVFRQGTEAAGPPRGQETGPTTSGRDPDHGDGPGVNQSSAARDWQLNHVGSAYGMMDEVFKFVETFKEFPPRSFPPSFNPANIMESTIEGIKQRRALQQSVDVERIRGRLNQMIDEALQHRSAQ